MTSNDLQQIAAKDRFGAWLNAVDEPYEACFWPGPKTMDRPARAEQLVGRDDDAKAIAYLVQDTNVVVLSGNSGVGKSSMLGMKIYPQLEALGFRIGMLRRFPPVVATGKDGRPSLKDISIAIRSALQNADAIQRRDVRVSGEKPWDIPADTDVIEWLEARYGKKALIILDQFEEVIRQQPELLDVILLWIDKVVASSGVRILISLRAEYAYKLRSLVVGAYQRADVHIEPLQGPADIKEVIRRGRRPDETETPDSTPQHPRYREWEGGAGWTRVIDDDAVDLLYDQWRRAGGDERTPSISLLHLQAALFVIGQVQRSHDTCITGQDVHQAIKAADEDFDGVPSNPRSRRQAKWLFDWALRRVIKAHFTVCAASAEMLAPGGGRDLPLEYGTRALLAQIAPRLSSGGYKIEQSVQDLGKEVFRWREEKGSKVPARGAERPDDPDLACLIAGDLPTRMSALWPASVEAQSGEVLRSAGVLAGLSTEAVAVQTIRCFQFALEWLRSGQLARLVPTSSGGQAVELAHDGFGDALREWAEETMFVDGAAVDVYEVRRIIGETLQWGGPDSSTKFFDGAEREGGYLLISNVAWISCRVTGTWFHNVVFMNCDFSDSKFEECSFEGATFINCILDGAAFDRCVVWGSPESIDSMKKTRRDKFSRPPAFTSADHPELDDEVHQFLQTQSLYSVGTESKSQRMLYSQTSGNPLVAIDAASDQARGRHPWKPSLPWKVQQGGLSFAGGRLSSLAFTSLRAENGGGVFLREVVGTSVDFAEIGGIVDEDVQHSQLLVDLRDAVLRGVTFSPNLAARPSRIAFSASGCHLENVWFSAGLEGEADLYDCEVWQLFAGSPRSRNTLADDTTGGFDVILRNSKFGGVVNAATEDPENLSITHFDAPDADLLYEVSIQAENIDYRSAAVRRQLKNQGSGEFTI